MKKLFLLFTLILSFCGSLFAQSVNVPPITGYPVVYTGWTLFGGAAGAVAVDSEIEVTKAAANQYGRVYTNASYSVTPCGQFTVNFDFQIKQSGSTTIADGMAFFFLQSSVTVAEATGYGGSGLNIPANPNGLVLTFDTYDNNSDGQEPALGLFDYNGGLAGYVEGSATRRLSVANNQNFIDNGSWHHCLITYDAGAIKVFFDYSAVALLTGTYSINFAGQFGFSGACGGSYSTQSVKNVFIHINTTTSPILGNLSVCNGSTTSLSDSTSGGTWSSSNPLVGTIASTGVVTSTGVGTTTITYTYNGGACTATAVVTVNTQPAVITGTSTMCAGSTTALTDATGGGVWSSSNTIVATVGTSGTVTGNAAGTATISYTIGSCYVTQIVTVVTQPAVITGNTPVCQTFSITLSDGTGGGIWTSGTTTVAGIGSLSGVITTGVAGTSSITYAIGTCFVTAVVTVNTQPAIITGGTIICQGSTSALTDATGGGVWSSSNTIVATVGTNGTVTGNATGTATISYVIGSCYVTQTVTVNTAPVAITGNAPICQTFSITLSDGTTGGIWTSGTTAVAGIGSASGVITTGAAGTSSITYAIGTCTVTAVVTVNTQPAIITGTASVCQGSTTALTDATSGGIWSSSNTIVASVGTDGTVTGNAVGTATISYTIGSCFVTQNVTVNTQPTGITGNAPICQTFSITLLDGTTGGIWTSGTTTVATVTGGGIVTGGGVGTSVITYAIGTCSVTAVVTVNTQPAVITGTASVCQGSTTALTDVTTGGIWTTSNTIVAIVGTDGTVTGNGVGTATITYTIGSCYVTQDVTVNTQPVGITGNAPICQTFSVTLLDGTGGGIWTSGTTTVATVTGGGIVTGGGVGTSVITYAIGTCSVTAVVTVNTQPAIINGITGICQGSTTLLTDATGGGIWSSSNTAVASVGTDGTVTGNIVGTATISYTIGSCYVTQEVTVNTQPVVITGNAPICQTFSITLLDGTSGGIWTSGTTTVATITGGGIVTGGGVGSSVITYAIGTCSVTAVVTVNTQPANITGTFGVCESFSTVLTDATAGGSWSSSNTTVASVGTDGTVTGNIVGTATITYTIGSCYVTQEVTVNATPVAITGNSPICQTFSITLSDATGGGLWTSSTTSIATVGSTTGVVTGGGVGTAVITYSIGSCYVTTIVTVNTQPAIITGTSSVCQASTTALTDATGGGVWSSSNTAVGTVGTDGTVTGNTVGTTTITYTIGSCYVTQEVTVNTVPVAISGNTTAICQTFTITLSDATGGGLWSSATTTIGTVGSTSGVVTGIGVGTTIISYSIGSCSVTTIVTVDTQPAAISGTLTVCQGLTTSLSDATGGGTWSSVTGSIGTISTTGIVTGISSGTTIISYTLGICAAKAIVTVQPLPTVITGTKTVCSGSTTNLGDTPGGGTWSSSNTAVATVGVSTGVVTGQTVAVATTVTITYTAGSGCYMTTTVTVNPLPTVILGSHVVCFGSSVTLSDAGGGTWTSANTFIATVGSTTGVVTGVGVGVTTITYKLPTGCYVTAPMTVNPLPVAITGPTLVCVGSTITLSDLTGGGTWSSSNTLLATVGSTTGVVTGISSGVVTITYTLGTGCYVTYNVTVNTPPAIITPVGDTTFCPGGFVALTANTGAGLTYQWYVGGVAIPGALSSSYIATTAGNYQVKVTNSNGCSAFSIPMSVTIATPVASITATSSTTICAGTSITLDANIGIGLSYQWLLGGAAISGAVGATLTTNVAGDYSCVVTNSTGCSATSNVITVDTISSPTANITLSGPLTFCQGDSVVMTTDFAATYTYQWYNASGAITGATGQSYSATTTGTYYAIVTNSNGCTATSIVISVVVNPLPNVAITASGPTVFCAGGSVTLSAAAVAGDTYQWYAGGTIIAGATNASYLVTASGGYQVRVTDPTTGCTAETLADTTVTVVATPVILPVTPASFCWGGSALLSTSVSGALGGITYQWYFNGVIIPGATGPMYNAAAPGDYTCQITIPGSCTVTTVAMPVTEYPLPNPIVSFDGTYFQTGTYYVTYQWYKNLVPITGATTSSTPCLGSGDYKVAVTDTNGCQSYSDVYVDTACSITGGGSTGVANVNRSDIKIYPNPAQTVVHIESTVQVRAIINSIDGRAIMNVTAAKNLDISSLPDGIYMIMLYDDNGTMLKAEKLVKTTN